MNKASIVTALFFLFFQTLNAQNQWVLKHSLTIDIAPTGVLFDDNDKLMFISQGAGLYEVNNGFNTSISDAPANSDLVSFQLDGNDIWVGGYGGGGKYSNGVWEDFLPSNDLQGYAIYDVDVTNGSVWVAMESEGASHFNGTSWDHFSATNGDGILGNWHTCIAQNSLGDVFLGSNGFNPSTAVVNRFDGSSWTNINVPGFAEVTAIFIDSQDNIWVGGEGLAKYDGTSWTDYTTSIFDRALMSINESKDGIIYFGMGNGKVGFLQGNVATLIDTEEGFTFKGRPNGIAFDSNNQVYFCMGPSNGNSSAQYGIYKWGELGVATGSINNQKIEILPNPTSDFLQVSFEQPIESIVQVRLFTTDGKEVYQQKLNQGTEQKTIYLSGIAGGIYFLQLTKNDQTFLERIVINR